MKNSEIKKENLKWLLEQPVDVQYELFRNFEIVIEPNNLKYHLDNNTVPVITHSIEADKIELRFI